MSDTSLTAQLLVRLNADRSHYVPAVTAIREISPRALGWQLRRQVYEGLAANGMTEPRLLTCDLGRPTSADVAYLADLRTRVMTRFTDTLGVYRAHFRTVEKLQNQLAQPLAALAKAKERVDQLKAQIAKAEAEVPQKLQGQLGSATGEMNKRQAAVDVIQSKIDAEFAAARSDLPAFLMARRADEYTRALPNTEVEMSPAALLWLQHMILTTHKWEPQMPAFATIVNRYL